VAPKVSQNFPKTATKLPQNCNKETAATGYYTGLMNKHDFLFFGGMIRVICYKRE